MLQWPDSRGGQYALVLTLAGLIVAGRIGLQSDDLRAFINALELMLGVPLAAYGVVAGAHRVSRAGARFTRRLDRLDSLLESKTTPAEAPRIAGRAAADADTEEPS
jgi:hypothetical protein